MKFLLVIDMQNDFISGSLGTKEAQAIVLKVKEKIANFDGEIVFTRDTHYQNYLDTQEGKRLPVNHCIEGTNGWEIHSELQSYIKDSAHVLNKTSFGSVSLGGYIGYMSDKIKGLDTMPIQMTEPDEIELCGLCTGICVLSNAIILKNMFPEVKITVDASCCACVTPESHKTALEAMKLCQIDIINENE